MDAVRTRDEGKHGNTVADCGEKRRGVRDLNVGMRFVVPGISPSLFSTAQVGSDLPNAAHDNGTKVIGTRSFAIAVHFATRLCKMAVGKVDTNVSR